MKGRKGGEWYWGGLLVIILPSVLGRVCRETGSKSSQDPVCCVRSLKRRRRRRWREKEAGFWPDWSVSSFSISKNRFKMCVVFFFFFFVGSTQQQYNPQWVGPLSSPMAERKEEKATGKGLKNKEFPFFLSVWYVLVSKEYIFIHSALG